jgi:S-adenosylmethionine:tRNA ribosyltransferase-isomerase
MKESVKHIKISEFNYPLPDERIAKFPLPERDSSKLLVYKSGEVTDDIFRSLPNYLPQGALMVFNNTKVIRARLHFRKKTLSGSPSRGREEYGNNSQLSTLNSQLVNGALIEIFLLEPASPVEYQENFIATSECSWYCLVGNSKKWK